MSDQSSSERLQKIIAQAGLASRRAAEEWIADGLVTVNGKTAKLGDKATLGVDAIKVKGKLLAQAEHKVYYLFYKPKHVIAMINEDEEGRITIKNIIAKQIKERVFTVGRMDYQGEGAMILTNDGDLAQKILKSDHIIRRYHVKVDRLPSAEDLARLARGGRIEGRSMTPTHVRVAQAFARNAIVEISFEGMGQIDVRMFFENKGFFPERVARVGIGHLKADKLAPGSIKRLEKSSLEALLTQPELALRQIQNAVEGQARRMESIREDEAKKKAKAERDEKAGSTKRNRTGEKLQARADALNEKRAMGKGRAASTDKVEFTPRSEQRATRPGNRAAFGEKRAPAREGARPAFGDKPARGARPAFGDKRPTREGARPSFGDKPARGARPTFGDKPARGEKRSFGKGAPRGEKTESFKTNEFSKRTPKTGRHFRR